MFDVFELRSEFFEGLVAIDEAIVAQAAEGAMSTGAGSISGHRFTPAIPARLLRRPLHDRLVHRPQPLKELASHLKRIEHHHLRSSQTRRRAPRKDFEQVF